MLLLRCSSSTAKHIPSRLGSGPCMYTVALPRASSLDAILLRAPSLCLALEEMLLICLLHVNLLSTVTPRISRSSTSVIMALPKYRSIFVGFLFHEMVNALHLVGSNATLHLSAHLFMFSRSLLRLAHTASAWLGDLISQNKVASSAYRYSELSLQSSKSSM